MEKKNMQIVIILIVVALAVIVVFGFFGIGGFSFFGTQAAPSGQSPAQALLAQVQQSGGVTQLTGEDVTVGTGAPIAPGATISVNYVGALPNGTVFDSTSAHNNVPLVLVVAPDGSLHTPDGGSLIAGWSQGMVGMKEGGERLLAIPPSLGYGPAGQGPIPPNSTLIFDVQLVKVVPAGTAPTTASTTPAR